MDDRALSRARLQIRLLLVMYRAERRRARRPGGNPHLENRVRTRSLEILEDVQARLSPAAAPNPELDAEISAARDEIASQD